MGNKSFLLYSDSLDVLDHLTDAQAGILFKAIHDYHKGNDIDLDTLLNVAFTPIRNQLDRDADKYESICERNRANGLKGGRPKNPSEPTGKTGNPNNPSEPDTDTDTDNDTDIQKSGALPDFISKKTWSDVKKHRTKIKKPMTERAEELLLGKLVAIHEAGILIDDAVDMMVDKSWASICVEWYRNEMAKRGVVEGTPVKQYDPIAEDIANLNAAQQEGSQLFANEKPCKIDGGMFYFEDDPKQAHINVARYLNGGNTINTGVQYEEAL